ncbi:MAG: DUF1926 domain-containing protein [Candidatus Lokiarchaeota archaeon]|nr:DUF1926 domain-containing protein [Candidatus Lokiarchaeota archaeon]
MEKVNLPIVLHFHQPVDNFDHVIEGVYKRCYEPLMDRIKDSKVKFTMHFTGSMLDWFENKHPDYLQTVKDLCYSGQVELISGGYYEPILPAIPDDDKLGQIKLLTEKIKKDFGIQPKGMWLAERVWEPYLPRIIAKAGLEYVILDDNHFKSCGFEEADTYHHYTTEESGNVIKVFPINEPVRYLAPWQPVWKLRGYLDGVKTDAGDRIVLYMADAEKLGEWGTTHQLCYVRGHDGEAPFVEEFIKFIETTDWVKSLTLSECLKLQPRGLVYLPNASYDKMEEWVLPTPSRCKIESIKEKIKRNEINVPHELDLDRFVKGGFWRYFMVKYPEVNNMHKKVLHVHDMILKYEVETGDKLGVADAWRELYMAEANDSYWHGQFGGVYFSFLRHSVYKHAIEAEKKVQALYRAVKRRALTPKVRSIPFLKDGLKQVLLETSKANVYINPEDGGTLFELDYKPVSYNLMNTLARWQEAYHLGGNSRDLVADSYRKVAMRDHIARRGVSPEDFKRNAFEGLGGFATGAFIVDTTDSDGFRIQVNLKREGKVEGMAVSVDKRVMLKEDTDELQVKYRIQDTPADFLEKYDFMVEFPVYFNGDPKEFVLRHEGGEGNPLDGRVFQGSRFTLVDGTYGLLLGFELSCPFRIWTYSHDTYSRMNTDDYQSRYQAIGMVLLPSEKEFKISVKMGTGK